MEQEGIRVDLGTVAKMIALMLAAMPLAKADEPKDADDGMTAEQQIAFMKHWVSSKFAIKEFCKNLKPEKAAEFDIAWANALAKEEPSAQAYAVSPEIATDGAVRLKEYAEEAKRSTLALEGLTLSCDGALKGKSF